MAGDSILRETNYMRYIVFYCFNAISFAASLVVSLLLLLLHRDATGRLLKLTRVVMVVDLLALMGAYAAGTSHDRFTTVCASVLAAATAAYVIFAVPTFSAKAEPEPPSADDLEKHEVLMVLAIFVATVAYVAGLNPPGGFWRSATAGRHHHTAGDPVLQALHPIRYKFFFFSNTTSFIASLLAITFNVHYEKLSLKSIKVPLYGLVVIAILGIGGAYAAGSCRDSKHTTYVLALVVPVLLCIFLQWFLLGSGLNLPCYGTGPRTSGSNPKDDNSDLGKIREFIQLLAILAATVAYQAGVDPPGGVWAENGEGHSVGDPILLTTHPGRFNFFFYFNSAAFVASLVIMVMLQNEFLVRRHTLEAAMILDLFCLIGAYAAGSCRDTATSIYTLAMFGGVLVYVVIHIVFFTLDPSSGKYKKSDDEGNETKNSEVPTKGNSNPIEDNNKMIEQGNETKKEGDEGNVLETGEISAHGNPNKDNKSEEEKKKKDQLEQQREEQMKKQQREEEKKDRLEKMREVLLLVAILAATLSYQAGLTPPGGLWENDKFGHHAGFPVLLHKYPRRYKAFFYCNTGSFMASVALIVLLLNPNLYGPGIKCYALFVCMVAGMFSLIGAYAAGSSLHLGTSIVVLTLVLAVFAAVVYVAIIRRHQGDAKTNNPEDPKPKDHPAGGDTNSNTNAATEDKKSDNSQEAAMYLMLVGILAASVTYLTGLKPPGGLWREDGDGHSAGNPVLYDIDKRRYNTFFYSNSTSFMASVTVIVLLLPRMLRDKKVDRNKMPLWPMHTAMFLDMLTLLGAYAAGSARNWCTSKNVVLLLLPVLGFVALLFFWKKGKNN